MLICPPKSFTISKLKCIHQKSPNLAPVSSSEDRAGMEFGGHEKSFSLMTSPSHPGTGPTLKTHAAAVKQPEGDVLSSFRPGGGK